MKLHMWDLLGNIAGFPDAATSRDGQGIHDVTVGRSGISVKIGAPHGARKVHIMTQRYNITLRGTGHKGSWSPLRPDMESPMGFTATQVEAVIEEALYGRSIRYIGIEPRN